MTKQVYKPLEGIGLKPLSATELEYMNVIWNHPEGIRSEKIYLCFPQHDIQTKRVILHNIVKKGYICSVRQGRHLTYYPTVTSEDYQNALKQNEIQRRFGGSLENTVAAFCGKEALTEKQIQKLHAFIEELCEEDDDADAPDSD